MTDDESVIVLLVLGELFLLKKLASIFHHLRGNGWNTVVGPQPGKKWSLVINLVCTIILLPRKLQ